MKITLVCILVFVVFAGSSNQQCLTSNDNRLPIQTQLLYTGQQAFSMDLLQAINHLNPNGNILASPYSTYHALLVAYFISANKTEEFLKKTLKLDTSQDKTDIFSAYKLDKFVTFFRAYNSSYEFTSANRIYAAQQIALRGCMTRLFNEELVTENFQVDPEAARIAISGWAENRTHKMIKDLLPPGTINAQTNLLLVSAAYFKGKWEYKFDPQLTKQEIFYISPTKRTMVHMMQIEATFNYAVSETIMAHILELPYEGDDISMYTFLPPFSKEDGIETVLKRLTLENFVSVVNGSLSPRQVQVSLPRFSLEQTIELVPILEHLGVGNLFHQDADFSGLTGTRGLSLSASTHKAKMEVTEEGAKTPPTTATVSWRIIPDEEQIATFKCNRPFIYLIYNKIMHTVLFTGIYRPST